MFKRLLLSLGLSCLFTIPAVSQELTDCLINRKFIQDFLTKEAPWERSHGAEGDYLGCGLMYFSFVYSSKARVCVCLGSGGGFVPRILRQAQRELRLPYSKTYLIDGDMGPWGRPRWLSEDSFFRKNYPEIEIIIDTTHNVAMGWDPNIPIDYLHIDADHSEEGSWQDFIDYLPLMKENGIITFHDTNGNLPCWKIAERIQQLGFEVVNFKELWAGVAVIHLGKNYLNNLTSR